MNQSNRTYSAKQISGIIGKPILHVRARLKKVGVLYPFQFLPAEWQKQLNTHETKSKHQEMGIETESKFDPVSIELRALSYANAPEYNRRIFDKKATILHESDGLKGRELEGWVAYWNKKHPDLKTSARSINRDRKAVREHGMDVLLGKYGKLKGRTKVPDDAFEKFKELYLVEGGPSAKSCWRGVVGLFFKSKAIKDFPTVKAFIRRLGKEVGKSIIYHYRNGYQKREPGQ